MTSSESQNAITPVRVARVIWRRKFVCLAVAAVVLAGGTAFLLRQPKVYQSQATVALLPDPANPSALPNYPNVINSLIPTYISLVSSPRLDNQVAAALPFRMSTAELNGDLFAQSLTAAAVITIVGQNASPFRAQQIAAKATAAFLADVQNNRLVVTQVDGSPTVPTTPSSPRIKLMLGVILALAIIVGLAAGLIWDRLFAGQAPGADGEPGGAAEPAVLGHVPGGGLEVADTAPAAADDPWRVLRANFCYAVTGRAVRSVAVTSLDTSQGKSLVAARLARSMAELGLSVILVDADVRGAALHEVFGLDNGQGLTSAMSNGADPAALARPVTTAGLRVVTAGPPLATEPASGTWKQQLARFTPLADLVIVAGPALREDPGAGPVAAATDGAVLVASSQRALGDAIRLLGAGATILGAVLTDQAAAAKDRPAVTTS